MPYGRDGQTYSVIGAYQGTMGSTISSAAHNELMKDLERRKDEQTAAVVDRETASLRRQVGRLEDRNRTLEREAKAMERELAHLREMAQSQSRAYDQMYERCERAENEVLDLTGRLRRAEEDRDVALATAEAISLAQSL
jgi:predicted RNase H-like nuclease (RuvC/YqgF family)